MARKSRSRAGRWAGFTLIELLLVVVIILLASFVAMPSFVRSLRGARLRASLRTVIMVHRYARSLSVLQQKHAAVLFDTEMQTLEVVVVTLRGGLDQTSGFLEDRAQAGEGFQADAEPDLVRHLEEGVRILDVRIEKGGQENEGIYLVRYYPNGMCDAYSLRLADEKNKRVEIAVEPFSGQVKVEEL
ncbi:MAG: prepilin-type N-terminal cleavage/methylation domain-containing protein [Verrucomicrobia bacterium]|nr:prepilin-type N-terminal cleavage/methylation domain-containing protein [Verrucomicrobiota bacterium]MBU1909181.1 prepilin-type N-terminal cleavage/methylation domain-containing protein [Verrucomicrobiota bacterium]